MPPRRAPLCFVLMLCSLLAPRLAHADWTWLPKRPGFAPIIADPREPRFAEDWIEGGRVSARAGRRLTLLRIGAPTETGGAACHLSVDGMLWAWLSSLRGFNFPLETVDGSFGIALDRARGPWSARLRYGHASSHLADGIADLESRRFVYSRESVGLVGSYAPSARIGLHAGPTFMLRGHPPAEAFQFQLGGEARLAGAPARGPVPYAAVDLRLKRENRNRVNQSYELGLRLPGKADEAMRLTAGYTCGVSERGQLWHTPERFFHLGIAFGD